MSSLQGAEGQYKNKKGKNMKKTEQRRKMYGFLGAGFAVSALVAPYMIAGNAFAEGPSSYFDINTASCIIEAYNADNGKSATTIGEVEFDKVKNVSCSNKDMTNFHGLVLLTNLETLDISNNPQLDVDMLDFSRNKKLKSINVSGLSSESVYDFSENPNLETITADDFDYLITSAYVRLTEDGEYEMDLTGLKFLDASSREKLTFEDKDDILDYISVDIGGEERTISARGGYVQHTFYFDDENVVGGDSLYDENACTAYMDNVFICFERVYAGEYLDTDAIVKNDLPKIIDMEGYVLKGLRSTNLSQSVEIESEEELSIKGTYKPDADLDLVYTFEYDADATKVPDTGFFTNEDGGLNAANIMLTLAGTTFGAYLAVVIAQRMIKKSKVKNF